MSPKDRQRRPNDAESAPKALQKGASDCHFGDFCRNGATLQKPQYLQWLSYIIRVRGQPFSRACVCCCGTESITCNKFKGLWTCHTWGRRSSVAVGVGYQLQDFFLRHGTHLQSVDHGSGWLCSRDEEHKWLLQNNDRR